VIRQVISLADLRRGIVPDIHAQYDAFRKLTMQEKLNAIEETHHQTEKALMDEVNGDFETLSKEMLDPDEGKAIARAMEIFRKMKKDLSDHFGKEEQVVFPLIWVNERPTLELVNAIDELTREHRDQEKAMAELQEALAPLREMPGVPGAGKLVEKLGRLFTDVNEHIMKEDELTFADYMDRF